jgi:branched-chain amino acid transport system ATP-binding protein
MTALLAVTGLTKQFDGVHALEGVGLTVRDEESVGLIGPNGAGKTTLFDCISGRLRPDKGEVWFRDHRVNRRSAVARARLGMARTFQRIELFAGMTVADHLLVAIQARRGRARLWRDLLGGEALRTMDPGRREHEHARQVEELLELLGLADDAERPIEALTLGQARRVEVGRALASDPLLLLLDEPSSGLDRTETDALAAVLEQVRQRSGVAILLVEHNVPLVRRLTTRLYVLDAGRLIADGETLDVLDDSKVRTAYLGADVWG